MIEWSLGRSEPGDRDDYAWALNLCESIEQDLEIRPAVTDVVESGIHGCVFTSGERELAVTSVLGRTIQLSFADEITDRMDAEVHSVIRRLELEEARRRRRARPN